MKKRILLILMVLVIAAIPLTGCENTFTKARLSKTQDTSYTVQGNGGNAVQYGNFIYFINGYRGYDDADGKDNVWDKVTKGALYRVELSGTKTDNIFVTKTDEVSGLEFESTPFVIDKNGYEYFLSDSQFDLIRSDRLMVETDLNIDLKDEDDYEPDIIEEFFYMEDIDYRVNNVELVAPKVIGTSGYADGGIFIFDNYIYYASPNNQKSKTGAIQSKKTDFFRTDLNGKKTEKIYTTSSDSDTSPYKFYKQNSFTYLVVLDGTDIVSVKMNDKKVVSKSTIADNATAAYFPDKAYYDSKNNVTDGVEDFVYYTRNIEKEDGAVKTGNVIEVVRPNGKNRFELVKNGKTVSIVDVRDGLVFYKAATSSGKDKLLYTNMHNSLIQYNDNKSAYDELVSGTALDVIPSEYTSMYCFRPDVENAPLNNNVYVLGFTDNSVYIADNNSSTKILNEQALAPSVYNNTLYYASSSSAYYSVNIWTHHLENIPKLIEEQVASGTVVRNSFVANYFVFMGTVDDYATAYAKFYPINGGDTAKSIFIGERIEEDIKQPPQES